MINIYKNNILKAFLVGLFSSITIGGVSATTQSKTIINGYLQPNYDILSGNQDVAKNIFTDLF